MIKNTGSQVIGAQLITAADGSAFTGSVTCYVTGDGGTQAAGGTGSGACTHEGNGYHTYVPTQAETNYNLIAFTFTGSGAIPTTVQAFTIDARQTGDSYARLGAPAGASVSADIAANQADLNTIIADTDEIQQELADGGRLDLIFDAVLADTNELQTDWTDGGRLDLILDAASAPTAAAVADAVWDELVADHAGVGSTGAALAAAGGSGDPWATALPGAYGAGTAGKILGDNLNAPVGTVDTVVDAIKAVTDNLPNSGALTDLASAANLATTDGKVDDILTDTGTTIPATLSTIAGYIDTEITTIIGHLTDIKGAGWTDENLTTMDALIDSLVARLTAARAGYLDKLNVTGTLAHSDAAATYKADVTNLDVAISTRSSHSAADVKTAMEANGSDLDYLIKALVNKGIWTEANGNLEMFSDADVSLGTITAQVSTDGTYTTRKRTVI